MGSRSLMAESVARQVLENIRNGRKPSIRAIAIKSGYSVNSANVGVPQKTQSFQRIIQPYLAQLAKERDRVMKARAEKDLTKVPYSHLVEATDKDTKNIQLLSGRSTENTAVRFVVASELLAKHETLQNEIEDKS